MADINCLTNDGDTPLHLACENGHLNVVTVLLMHGADKSIKNKNGKTALDIAKEKEFQTIVNMFSCFEPKEDPPIESSCQ